MRHKDRTADTDELSAQSPTRRAVLSHVRERPDRPVGVAELAEAVGDGRRGQVVSTGLGRTVIRPSPPTTTCIPA